jgi:dihydroxyacetone kinase-like predicted kinase
VKGKEVAYKAVMRPVEGTILTVIRESSSALHEASQERHLDRRSLEILLKEAKKIACSTPPDLLPILKEVGVVDSGGAGLCVVIEGMDKAAHGQFVERNENAGRRSRFLDFKQFPEANMPAPSFPKTKKAMAIAPSSFSV